MSASIAIQDQTYAEQLAMSRADQFRDERLEENEVFENAGSTSIPQKELVGGPGYWVMLMAAVCVDMIGVLLDLLMVFTIFATLLSYTMLGIMWLYYYFHNIKVSGSKQKTFVISALAETIPLFNALSFLSFSFWLMCKQENKERQLYNDQLLFSNPASNPNN